MYVYLKDINMYNYKHNALKNWIIVYTNMHCFII